MALNKPNLKKLSILLAIILLAVLVPQHQVKADIFPSAADLVTGALQKVNEIMLQGVGTILKWAALTLEAVVKPETQAAIINFSVVQESWKIIRDFVNMFFILFLIIMAFGTIFDIQKYRWRDVLVPFLIAALLINFSLVIGQYIIGVGNGFASIFLKQIAGFGQDMANGFNVGKAIPGQEFTTGAIAMIANNSTQVIFTGIFSLIFLIVALFAFLAALLFTIIRIPILWLLLIISPIAWIGYVLPNLRKQTWSDWWKHFFCWCFFLPYYLFFLMFAVMFIRRKNELATLPSSPGAALFTGPGGALFDLLFYILTLIFLIGGLAMARKMACASGSGIKTVFGKIEGGVKKYMPGAAYVRGAWGGLKARGEEIKEKGALGIGGEQRAREAEARARGWIAGIPGLGRVPGAREEADRAMLEEINKKEAPKLALELQRLSADQQKVFLQNAQGRKGVAGEAALFEYVKRGYSTSEDYKKAIVRFGGENSALGRQYLENLKSAKLSDLFKSPDEELRIARGQTEGTEELVNLRRELYKDLAKRNQINDVKVYAEAKQLLSPIPAELKSFLDSIKPEYIFGTKDARKEALRSYGTENDQVRDADLVKKLVDYMSEKDKKEMTDTVLREKALAVVGGKDTFEGKRIISEINKFNPTINIEADLRQEVGIPTGPLSDADQNKIIDRLSDELAKKNISDIKKLSSEFFKNPLAQESLLKAYEDPEMISAIIKGASPEVRRVLPKLQKIADKLATDKKRAQRRQRNELEEEEPAEEEGEENQ